jgi:hypothetical protein
LTINTSTTVITAIASGTAFSGLIKDVSVTPPEGSVEVVNFLGEDAAGFQNASFEEKAFSGASIKGTMVLDSIEYIEPLFGGAGTQVATNTYTRYQYGTSASGKTRVKVGAIGLALDNGTKVVGVLLNNVMLTKLGDIKMTGADGHWERDFEGMCLAADYYEDFKN